VVAMYNSDGDDDNKNISFIDSFIYNKVVVMYNDNGKGGGCLMWTSRRNK
jgi:hypothetical protein